jgi:ABC-type antimicrobial peptide transport system permease subunit
VFVPFRGARGVLYVRSDGEPTTLAPEIRRAVKRVGAGNAVSDVVPMRSRLRDATARDRLSAQVFTAFAASALLLAAIGVYGTLALRVSQRTRELAIRRALGATGSMVLSVVSRQAASIAIIGMLVGAVLAALVARGLESLLYGVEIGEPTTYAVSAGLLLMAIAVATVVPAVRSLRVDPRDAMRSE